MKITRRQTLQMGLAAGVAAALPDAAMRKRIQAFFDSV